MKNWSGLDLHFQVFGGLYQEGNLGILLPVWHQGLRKNGLNFAVSLLHIYFFIEKKRKNERNAFPITGITLHFKQNFEFFLTMKRPVDFGGYMQLNSFMNKQNSSSLSEFELKLGVDGILVANSQSIVAAFCQVYDFPQNLLLSKFSKFHSC